MIPRSRAYIQAHCVPRLSLLRKLTDPIMASTPSKIADHRDRGRRARAPRARVGRLRHWGPLSAPSNPGVGVTRNRRDKSMHHEQFRMNRSLQCGARTRAGKPCRSPAVRGKRRCRMHGGARGSGAPIGNKNAFRHGLYSGEAIALRRIVSELIRTARDTVAKLE